MMIALYDFADFSENPKQLELLAVVTVKCRDQILVKEMVIPTFRTFLDGRISINSPINGF